MSDRQSQGPTLAQLGTAGIAPRKKILGLTGNPGAGKSTAAQLMQEEGARLIDADAVGHQMLEPGSPAFDSLIEAFGRNIVDEAGKIDRKKLGSIVFQSPPALERLNQLVHPPIQASIQQAIEAFRSSDEEGPLVIDAALIFEWGIVEPFDAVIVVAAPRDLRQERFETARGGASAAFEKREQAQLAQEEKIKRADAVIWNDQDIDALRKQIQTLFDLSGPAPG